MQEFSYSNSIHVNNKFESVPTDILYYKWNKYYHHLTVKDWNFISEWLKVTQCSRAEPEWVPN